MKGSSKLVFVAAFALLWWHAVAQTYCTAIMEETPAGWKDNRDKVMDKLVNQLVNQSSRTDFAIASEGQNPYNMVYGMLQCNGGITPKECNKCAKETRSHLFDYGGYENCIGMRAERGLCYLRYDTWNFTGILDTSSSYSSSTTDDETISNADVLKSAAKELFETLIESADDHYGSGSVVDSAGHNITAMVQCWKDISVADCKACLRIGVDDMFSDDHFKSWPYAQAFLNSCLARYSVVSSSSSSSLVFPRMSLFFIALGLLFAIPM